MSTMLEKSKEVIEVTQASFMEESTKRYYIQYYQYRLKELQKLKS